MNQFEIEETKLVNVIVNEVKYRAMKGVQTYSESLDWDAAATAVIELVKERLSKQ